jgi:predicted TPR repeat methyltransferase
MAPSDTFARIARYYDALVERHGHHYKACDYGRRESQQVKFRVLSEVMPLAGKRILDVGCGFADYADYLGSRYGHIFYTGIDLSRQMIEEARRVHPGVPLHVANVLDGTAQERFDVVTANGIFYLLGEDAPVLVRRLIQAMFTRASEAVAFNSLSTWAEERTPGEFHADPVEILEFCRRLTPWVTLRHDYLPRDFTMYLYRDRPA